MMLYDLREGRRDRKKARQALRYMHYPCSIHYLARDEINRPAEKRAAQWMRYKTKRPRR